MTVPSRQKSLKKLGLIVSLLIGLILTSHFTGLRSSFTPMQIKDMFGHHQVYGILLFCLVFSLGNLLYVPGWVFLVAAVVALGKEWGGLVTFTAAITSCTLSYFLIYKLGGDALRTFNNKWADKAFLRLDETPVISVATLRLIFQTAPPLNYALALSNVRFSHYLVGTLVGLPLPIFAYCYFFEIIFKKVIIELF